MIKKVILDKQVEFTDKKEAADFGLNKNISVSAPTEKV